MLKRVVPEGAQLPEKKAKKHAAPRPEQSKYPALQDLLKQRLEYKLSRNDDGVMEWHELVVIEMCNTKQPGWYSCALDADTTKELLFENSNRDKVWRNAAAAAAAAEKEEQPKAAAPKAKAAAPKAKTGAQEAKTGAQEAQDDDRDEKLADEMEEFMGVVGRQADREGSRRLGLQWHTAARQIGLDGTSRSDCGDAALLASWATGAPLIRRLNPSMSYKRITVTKLRDLERLVSIWLVAQKAARDEKHFSGGGIGESMAVGDQPAESGACSSSSGSGGDGGGASSSIKSGRPLTTLTLNDCIAAHVRTKFQQYR
jgi:hypothetical protein